MFSGLNSFFSQWDFFVQNLEIVIFLQLPTRNEILTLKMYRTVVPNNLSLERCHIIWKVPTGGSAMFWLMATKLINALSLVCQKTHFQFVKRGFFHFKLGMLSYQHCKLCSLHWKKYSRFYWSVNIFFAKASSVSVKCSKVINCFCLRTVQT